MLAQNAISVCALCLGFPRTPRYHGRMSQKTRHRGGNRTVKSKNAQHAKTVLAILLLGFVAVLLALWLFSCVTN